MIKKKRRIRIPGEELIKFLKYDQPVMNGIYLVYYKLKNPRAWSSTFQRTEMALLEFRKGKWVEPLNVLGYMGPFPILTEDELLNRENHLHIFTISTLKKAANLVWTQGPFVESIDIQMQEGKEGDFGFEYNLKNTLPNTIKRYSKTHQKFINIKNPDQYIKKMQTFQKKAKFYAISTLTLVKQGTFLKKSTNFLKLKGFHPKKNQYIFEVIKEGNNITPIYQEKGKVWWQVSEQKANKIIELIKGGK
jgi:hypothetical protein